MKHAIPVLTVLAIAATVPSHGAGAELIAVFTKNVTNPFSKAIRQGADVAAKKLGIDISHYVPTTPDNADEQTRLVNDAIAKKPDAIVFDPVDKTKLDAAIAKINEAKIPVIEITDRATGGSFVASVCRMITRSGSPPRAACSKRSAIRAMSSSSKAFRPPRPA